LRQVDFRRLPPRRLLAGIPGDHVKNPN